MACRLPGFIPSALLLVAGALIPSAARAQGAPTFNERTIEISPAHVSALLAGIRMQNDSLATRWAAYQTQHRAYEDSVAAMPARRERYTAEHARWEECQERTVKPAQARAEAEAQRAERQMTGGDPAAAQKAMEAVAERIKAAQQRGDMKEVMRLADSVGKASMQATATMTQSSGELQEAAAACGAEPEEPEEPHQPFFDRSVPPIPLTPALWKDSEQYGIMFDRIEPLLSIEAQGDFDRALRTTFSPAEQQAIGAQAAALRSEMQRQRSLLANG